MKFGYFSLFFIILSYYSYKVLIILFPFILILFIQHLNQYEEGFNIIKENAFILLGIISVAFIYLIPEEGGSHYPDWLIFFLSFLSTKHYFIFVCILGMSLLLLNLKKCRD